MNALIALEHLSPQPISAEILALNEVSRTYGLTLTEEEARELSETRKTALVENERVEAGVGAVPEIVRKFCASRYIDKENYTYVLNEITYLFYYIKTETDDKIGDRALIDELFERFELYCRGSVDLLESREAERIIRKVNAGKHYVEWYGERDELDGTDGKTGGAGRETPASMLDDAFGEDHFRDEVPADHDRYENEEDAGAVYDEEGDPDAFDDFEGLEPGKEWPGSEDTDLYEGVIGEQEGEADPENPLYSGLYSGGKLDVSIEGTDAELSVGSSDYMGLFDGGDDSADTEEDDDDGDFDLEAFDAFFDRQARQSRVDRKGEED